MPKRSRTGRKSDDPNVLAHDTLRQVTEAAEDKPEKNPAAVALGRLGGLKGGKARAKKLTAEQRKEIARKGAAVRWRKKSV
jgi:hypothetical protein